MSEVTQPNILVPEYRRMVGKAQGRHLLAQSFDAENLITRSRHIFDFINQRAM